MLDTNSRSESLAPVMFSPGQLIAAAKDPAAFALTFLIVNKDRCSLKDLYERVPEALHGLLDTLLIDFEAMGVIEIKEGMVETRKKLFEIYSDEQLKNFLPNVFEIAATKILNTSLEEVKVRKEGIQYYVFPDNPELTQEAGALIKEFKFKMEQLKNKSVSAGLPAEGHRMIGFYNYKMELEDFV